MRYHLNLAQLFHNILIRGFRGGVFWCHQQEFTPYQLSLLHNFISFILTHVYSNNVYGYIRPLKMIYLVKLLNPYTLLLE